MLKEIKMPKKIYNLILVFTSIIILSISLEALFKVKDILFFEKWLTNNNIRINNDFDFEEAFNSYIALNIGNMFMKILIPASLSINSYLAYTKTRVNKLYIYIWFIFLIGGLVYEIIGFNISSIFFYINIVAYIGLIITILLLNGIMEIQDERVTDR